jgi:outer membrane receptor protein involved in Fe transport
MICGAALAAFAATSASAQEAEVSEIVVTGSRIPQPNLTSVSPIQVVTDQEFKLQGKTDTVDLINNLPQIVQNNGVDFSSTSNPLSGPGGISTANLRGLGPQRTLVLIDGRRLGIGDANTGNPNPAPDLNQIPSQLVDRVEVLTGGASAVYGSDAVAGVVNFVMKRNFEGVQIDGQWGVNQHSQQNDLMQGLERSAGLPVPKGSVWDGKARDLSLIFGVNGADGKANITAYLTYHDQDPIQMGARDYSACQLNVDPTPRCAGSSNSNIFYDAVTGNPQFAVVGNQFVPYSRTAITSPPALFNSNPYEYLLHQDTRYTGGFFAHYDINKAFNLYSDFSYMHDRTTTQVAPAGLFQGSGVTANAGFLVNCNNPLLSAQEAATICTPAQIASGGNADLIIGRRNVEGDGRQSFYEHENYRIVVGSKGQIAEPWHYDVYAQYYYTTLLQDNRHYLSLARIQNALQVVPGPNGTPVCISGGSCVPYNIFNQGGVTPDQVSYLDSSGLEYGSVRQSIISANITGDLSKYGIQSPWADDGLGVALGAEYRREHLVFKPDEASLSGDLSGFGGASAPINNSLNTKEVYGELRVPLIQKRPFIEDLLVELGYRYSDYSTGIQAKTYKIGLQYAPTEDIRFRTSYQKAIRAPSIIELYSPVVVTNTSDVAVDPCSGTVANPATATLAQCLNTGVTAAQYGNGSSTNTVPQCPAGQCATTQGGNIRLQPETAKTFSVGFTLTPRFVSGLTASVDYYDIRVANEINNVPLSVILSNCLNSGDPFFCSQVVRAPNGILFGTSVTGGGFINGTLVNIGSAKNSGIDFQGSYDLPMERFGVDKYGGLQLSFIGSYTINAKTKPVPGEHTYDCAGLFGVTCQSIYPVWRHTLRLTWKTPWDVLASVAWRHINGVKLETTTNDPTLGGGGPDPFNGKLPSRDYLDLAATWHVNDRLTLRAGVTNVLDQDPPLVNSLIAGTGTPNTYGTYDLLGRQMFMAFTANF